MSHDITSVSPQIYYQKYTKRVLNIFLLALQVPKVNIFYLQKLSCICQHVTPICISLKKKHIQATSGGISSFEALKEFYILHLPLQEVQLLKSKMVAWHYRNYSCHFLGKK
jgi:hypothetical protein